MLTSAQLLDAIHADFRDVSERAVDKHVKNLRRKLSASLAGRDGSGPRGGGPNGITPDGISTVYGVGYRLELPAEDDSSASM